MSLQNLNDGHLDLLKEVTNIGLGRAAGTLNKMLSTHIELSVPAVKELTNDNLNEALGLLGDDRVSIVELDFATDFTGSAALVFPVDSSKTLIQVITGEEIESDAMSAVQYETFNEVGSVVLNNVLGSLGNLLEAHFTYGLPLYTEQTPNTLVTRVRNEESFVLFIEAHFIASEFDLRGQILLFFEVSTLGKFVEHLDKLI